MKKLIITILATINIIANAATVETLTLDDTTYKATIHPSFVAFNQVGKTSLTKTNLDGWLYLKTNLIKSGFILTLETNKVSPINPKQFRMTKAMYDEQNAYKKQNGENYERMLAAQALQRESDQFLREMNKQDNAYKVISKTKHSDGSWSTMGKVNGATVFNYSDGSWSRHE